VPNAVIIRELQVLSVRQEVRNYSVTTDKSLTITPTAWQNLYFKDQITIVGLSGITLQIWQLDITDTPQHRQRPHTIICDLV